MLDLDIPSYIQKSQQITLKMCSSCKAFLPATSDYFYRTKLTKDGFNGQCKECCKKGKSIYYQKNREKVLCDCKKYREKNADEISERLKLILAEEITNNNGLLMVKCAYCGKFFSPTNRQVGSRIRALQGVNNVRGEHRFYCSTGCKESCPIYKQVKFPKGFRKASSREANPELRQIVLKRDNYTCQKCGATEYLHCHHVVPARQNPMTANDPDVCITLCKTCHKEIHKQDGCKHHELKC